MKLPVKSLASFFNLLRWVILLLLVCLTVLLVSRESVIQLDQSIYYTTVSNRIQHSILDAEEKSQIVCTKIKNGETTFSQLNKIISPSHFYVFESGKPVYWSNAEYVPSYKSIKGNNAWSYISNNSGKYLVHKDKIGRAHV